MAVLALILLVQIASILASESNRRCSGGYAHGSQVDRGRYWYECQDGQLVPKGCLTEDYRRMDLWDTYDDRDGVRMQCVVDRDGYLTISYKSCVQNGREYQVNELWEDNKNYYSCKKDREFVQIEVAGCMDNGRRVGVDEKIVKDQFVYQCKKAMDKSHGIVKVGCYENGRQYAVGDSFDRSNLWYTCTTSNNGPDAMIITKCIGCVHDGKRLRDGDHVVRDDVLYGCRVNGEDTRLIPAGCVTHVNGATLERRLNCSWVEGDEPYQYEVTCKFLEHSNSAVRQPVRCNYSPSHGTYNIDPGCYRIVDKSCVGCVKESDGRLQIRIDNAQGALGMGLRYC